MANPSHDPIEYANQLSKKLSSSSRRVVIFLGSGASAACGLPTMDDLKQSVLTSLDGENQEIVDEIFQGRNLEEGLSRLRKIKSLLEDGDEFNGIDGEKARTLDERICRVIINELSLEEANLSPMRDFATWIDRTTYNYPVEIFTTNYDLALETSFESTNVNYFDGFVGNLEANFKPELVERDEESFDKGLPADFARLWKVHGSVNWVWRDRGIVRLGIEGVDESAAAIYPAETKYEESRRVPFLVLQDRLRRSLFQDEVICLISGYGFNDQHLNELFFRAIQKKPRSDFAVFCHSELPENLAERALKYPNLQVMNNREAIIGGEAGSWDEPDEEREFVWEDGDFLFHDFANLASFLSRSAAMTEERTIDDELTELLETLAESE